MKLGLPNAAQVLQPLWGPPDAPHLVPQTGGASDTQNRPSWVTAAHSALFLIPPISTQNLTLQKRPLCPCRAQDCELDPVPPGSQPSGRTQDAEVLGSQFSMLIPQCLPCPVRLGRGQMSIRRDNYKQ